MEAGGLVFGDEELRGGVCRGGRLRGPSASASRPRRLRRRPAPANRRRRLPSASSTSSYPPPLFLPSSPPPPLFFFSLSSFLLFSPLTYWLGLVQSAKGGVASSNGVRGGTESTRLLLWPKPRSSGGFWSDMGYGRGCGSLSMALWCTGEVW